MTIKNLWDNFTDQYSALLIHPQYIIKRYGQTAINLSKEYAHGILVDIGCGRMPYREALLPYINKYIGVDHPKTSKVYKGQTKPEIFADATKIPIPDNACDSALLLMVVEHLPNPQKALNETNRILKHGGILILSTVQNYPIHDAPYDYQRFTKYGLINILNNSGFKIIVHQIEGNVFIFSLQNLNLFLMYFVKTFMEEKPAAYFTILALPFVLIITTISNFLSLPFLHIKQESFALTHTIVAKKISPPKAIQ